jgi:Rrf2 family protein
MKLPQRIHYGLVLLLQLHFNHPNFKTVKEVAQTEAMPQKFLEGIAADLKNDGLVEVKRGAHGGYRLVRPLKERTLMEVVRALAPEWERSMIKTDKQGEKSKTQCVEMFLDTTSAKVVRQLENVYLGKLVDLYNEERNLMYYI